MKKFLTALLALLMLLSCFSMIACQKEKTDETNTTGAATGGPIGNVGDANSQLDLPKDLKYNNTFSILMFDAMVDEFGDPEADKRDDIEQALFERDAYIEELLGLEFEYTLEHGHYEYRYTFSDKIRNSVAGGGKSWDLVAAYAMVPPNLALNNSIVDLRTVDHINFDKVWYPEFMVDIATVNNKTYYITGDISTNSLYGMQAVAFSAVQAEARGITEESLYQMVYDNEWTIENMLELVAGLAQELDGDGVWDDNDFYPVVSSNAGPPDAFYYASGMSMINETEDGKVIVSEDILSEKVLDIYSILYDAQNTQKSYITFKSNEQCIMNGKCIFSMSPVINFRTHWAESQERLRVLPFPKYQESDPYRTYLMSWTTFYCVPANAVDPDCSGAVMEAMGYLNYHTVTPVIYEETMKLRYSENEDCAAMFDYLRDGRTFELATLHGMAFDGHGLGAYTMFRTNLMENDTNWVSTYKNDYESNLTRVVGLLNNFYSK